MKLTFTLLALVLSSCLMAASNLTILSSKAKSIRVIIDNRTFNSNSNSITIKNISSGRHKLQVLTTEQSSASSGLFLNRTSGKWKNILNKQLNINNRVHYDVVITRNGRIFTDEEMLESETQTCTNEELDYSGSSTGAWGSSNTGNQLSSSSYYSLKSLLQKESFDQNKLSLIKDALRDNLVSIDQAKELASKFSFESSKLEYAKYVYTRLTDKSDAFMLYDIFSFSASKTEFSEFINK